MANWKENKMVGVVAAAAFILAMIFMARSLMTGPGQAKLSEAGKKGVPPAEEMLGKK